MYKLVMFLLQILYVFAHNECIPRDFGYGGTVCVCNSSYCDTIDPLSPLSESQFVLYTSNKDGLRFNKTVGSFTNKNPKSDYTINIDASIKYQTIFGFGGAFTDSFGINVNSLNGSVREYLMQSYFSDQGLEYSLCRVPIGGTDFSTRPYTYDDFPGDVKLNKFNLTLEDLNYKIPLIKQALSLRKGQLQLVASPWSSPAWVKTNNALSGMGVLHKKYYQYWAEYLLKFLQYYDNENINFWGITTGNEPGNALIPFIKINSLGWLPWTQNKWIAENLGPTIRNSKYKDIKIMVNDDQRFYLPWFPKWLFSNEKAKNFTDGIAVHWYWDKLITVKAIQITHDLFPDKFILATEACAGDKFYQTSVEPGSWYRAEMYADDIINDINHWVTGWMDWNMALNEKGGPTYIDNYVDSPILINANAQEFYKNPMFYAMGHFSKFVPAGSIRIQSIINDSVIKICAFQRPDNATVLIIFNSNNNNIQVTISDKRRGSVFITATKRSINTFIYW